VRVGVLGGGQLGRMLGLAGVPLGLRFRFLEPAPSPPAAAVGEVVRGEYADPDALARFADGVDVVTFEFENVPAAATEWLRRHGIPVFPPPAALAVAQDRLAEKEAFGRLGIPTPPYLPVSDEAGLRAAVERLGLPSVLKTRRMGYDGKGQAVLRTQADVALAWETLGGGGELILEGFIRFDRELSIVAVRGRDGAISAYPLVENLHVGGILRRTVAPAAGVAPPVQAEAERQIRALLESLDYVGVLALELFEVGGRLLANEIAPRVHNSGHWTQDGAHTSQFENHLRAVLGWPLGSTAVREPTVMYNLIGELPRLHGILAETGTHLHLYDKGERPGRKLGHVNVCRAEEGMALATGERLMGESGVP